MSLWLLWATLSWGQSAAEPYFSAPFDRRYFTTGFFDHDALGTGERRQLTAWGSVAYGKSGHLGWDWAMVEGTPIFALADGVVEFGGDRGPTHCAARTAPHSREVWVRHVAPNGQIYRVGYFHLDATSVSAGDRVRRGQVIGRSGNTGCSSGPHLHLFVEVVVNRVSMVGVKIDPYGWSGPGVDPRTLDTGVRPRWLWRDGEAPEVMRMRRQPATGAGLQVVGIVNGSWQDDRRPNAETITFALGPDGERTMSLAGLSIRNNAGDQYRFPEGAKLRRDAPIVVYSGGGVDTDREWFWGSERGLWDDASDCIWVLDDAGEVVLNQSWGRRAEDGCAPESRRW